MQNLEWKKDGKSTLYGWVGEYRAFTVRQIAQDESWVVYLCNGSELGQYETSQDAKHAATSQFRKVTK